MRDIILESLNKIRSIESRQNVFEALTPEEQKELDALAKELEPQMGRLPELDDLLLQHQKLASGGQGQAAQPAKSSSAIDPETLKKYQEKLGVTADGKMGPQTKAAVMKFQKDNGLTVDGIIGPKTSAALDKQPASGQAAQPAQQPSAAAQAADPDGDGNADDPEAQTFVAPYNQKAPAAAPTQQAPAQQAPAAAPAQGQTKTTTSNTQVSGTMKMGKPDGPIQYNGKTVNPGDPAYAAASQALIQSQQKAQQARGGWRGRTAGQSAQPTGASKTVNTKDDF